MARVSPGGNPPGKGKSLRGRVVFRTWRGLVLVQRWPRPRGKPKTEQHRQQVAWFTQAQKLAKRADPKTQITIAQATSGTPLMPRDLATSLMAGRTADIAYGPHRIIRSRRAMSAVSQSLDIISNQPGATLVRGTSVWQGQTIPSDGALWFNPNPAGAWTGGLSTSAFAWKGRAFTPQQAVTITAVGAIMMLYVGQEYRAAVAKLNGSEEITEIHFSPPQAPGRAGREFMAFPLIIPLQTGERAALVVGRIDGTGTSPVEIGPDDGAQLALPASAQRWLRSATLDLAPGVVFDSGTGPATDVFPQALF